MTEQHKAAEMAENYVLVDREPWRSKPPVMARNPDIDGRKDVDKPCQSPSYSSVKSVLPAKPSPPFAQSL